MHLRGGLDGGVRVHTSTIPSKTMREAILQLAGFSVEQHLRELFFRRLGLIVRLICRLMHLTVMYGTVQ